jgi:hypothetical protein
LESKTAKISASHKLKGKHPMNTLIQLKSATKVFLVALACFGLSPTAQSVSPPPNGGYPGGNTAEGQNALLSLTTGTYNTAVGAFSLLSDSAGNFNTGVGAGTLLLNVGDPATLKGIENTAVGAGALLSNTLGADNTATGAFALFSNDIGEANTAVGNRALFSNTTGDANTATGTFALNDNTTGADNTAIGFAALVNNATGGDNTATGGQALLSNTTGDANTATGTFALNDNTTGPDNTAIGFAALVNNITGGDNTATGGQALLSNTTGNFNTATGTFALNDNTTGAGNTAIGFAALVNNTTGHGDTALGSGAGSGVTTASNVIAIGNPGQDVSNSCYMGNIYSNIQPQVGTDPDLVTINSSGRLGRANVSSRRYKHDIKPMHKASERIYALKPVSFRYHKQYDATQTIAFGLIAEDVAEVLPELVGRNEKGEPESVRYDQVNAMLLNEFLKEHRKNEEQQANIAELKTGMAALTVMVKEQAAQIQKANARLEMTALQVVQNNQ